MPAMGPWSYQTKQEPNMTIRHVQAGVGAALLILLVAAPVRAQGAYEASPVQSASKILPAALVSGPRFKVQDEAPTDDFMPQFTIKSDFGDFVVSGREMVGVRVQEIAA